MDQSRAEDDPACVNPDLLQRLRLHQDSPDWRYPDRRAEMVRELAEFLRHARRGCPEHDRDEWLKLQAAKRARWLFVYRRILARRPCAYCGGAADGVDHVIPRCRGGSDTARNLVPACRRCNSEKGKRTPEEWEAQRLHRGRPWPPQPVMVLFCL